MGPGGSAVNGRFPGTLWAARLMLVPWVLWDQKANPPLTVWRSEKVERQHPPVAADALLQAGNFFYCLKER